MLTFHPQGWDDYLWWQQHDKQGLRKLNQLIRAIQRDPFEGIGKPEPLCLDLTGFWSRRITHEHHLIYGMEGEDLIVAQCRGHYD